MAKNIHFTLKFEKTDPDFFDTRNEKCKICEKSRNREDETRREETLFRAPSRKWLLFNLLKGFANQRKQVINEQGHKK